MNCKKTKLKDGIKRFVLKPFELFVSFVVNRMRTDCPTKSTKGHDAYVYLDKR